MARVCKDCPMCGQRMHDFCEFEYGRLVKVGEYCESHGRQLKYGILKSWRGRAGVNALKKERQRLSREEGWTH